MNMQEILEEAKRRYPIGTKYISAAESDDIEYESKYGRFQIIGTDTIWGDSGEGVLYQDGEWAKITNRINHPIIY